MNEVFVITGTSSGVGKGLAERLIKGNKRVIGISSSENMVTELTTNSHYTHLSIDLKTNDSLNIDLEMLLAQTDRVYLILNAAQFSFDSSLDINISLMKEIFNVNFFSAVELVKKLKPWLNRVIFVNSISGLNPQINQSVYSSSKHSLQAYSKILAKESQLLEFDVMSINPGGIKSTLWSKVQKKVDTKDFINVETIVDVIEFMLSMPKKTYIPNFTILPASDIENN